MSKTVGKPIKGVEYRLGPDVQAADELAGGRKFTTCNEYKKLLLSERDQIARSLTGKMLTYALGRGLTFKDRPAEDAILADVRKANYGFRTLVTDIIRSPLFITN